MYRRFRWRRTAAFAVVILLVTALSIVPYFREPNAADLIDAIQRNDAEKASAAIAAGVGHQRHFDHTYASGWFFPIHAAAFNGRIAILEQLLEAGADPNQVDHEGETPLIWLIGGYDAGLAAGQLACLRRLVDAGADLESRYGRFEQTALHKAARQGNGTLVRELIALGAHVNAQRADGSTPLHEASVALVPEPELVVSILLAAGADPTLTNKIQRRRAT